MHQFFFWLRTLELNTFRPNHVTLSHISLGFIIESLIFLCCTILVTVIYVFTFQASFPNWNTMNLKNSMKKIEPAGLDLLEAMLVYDPSKRISAKKALLHPYFEDLDKNSLPAKPGEYEIKIQVVINNSI